MKKVSYERIAQEVHASKLPARPLCSRIKDAVLITGIVGALAGCGGAVTSNMVASLVDIPVSSQNEKSQSITTVKPDLGKTASFDETEKKELQTIEVSWLKDQWKKNVGESGWQQKPGMATAEYTPDGLFTTLLNYNPKLNTGFNLHIAYTPEKAIKLKNGAAIGGFVIIPEEGNSEVKAGLAVDVVKNGVNIGSWKVPFDKLAEAYKEETGTELRYVLVVVEHDIDKNVGEYLEIYIVPVSSFNDVEKGNIKSGMPALDVSYLVKPKDGESCPGCGALDSHDGNPTYITK